MTINYKNKISIIIGLCIILCICAFIIISKTFNNFEVQLTEKCRIEALTGARMMSEFMEFMLSANILKESEIFDTEYKTIKGTKPEKFHTKYDRIFDKYLQKIEDVFLLDPDVDFAVLIDNNGYVPTHNSSYSKPMTGKYSADLLYSRSKRIFIEYPAIEKAIKFNENGTIKLLYYRDTGETMWNVASPVKLRGRKWGSFLIGVSLKRVNEIKNQMLILIVMVMFVLFTLSMLAIFAILPRKLFVADLDETKY